MCGFKCFICGGDLCWENDFSADEIYNGYEGGDGAIVSFYHCVEYGRSYTIADPTKEEKEEGYSNYWGKDV